MWGGGRAPLEENVALPDFTPESAHLLLQGVYGDYLYHNNESHLDRGVADGAIWQRRWCRITVKLASWYATPSGEVGRRFTSILAAE